MKKVKSVFLLTLFVLTLSVSYTSSSQSCFNGKRKTTSSGTQDCRGLGDECMKSVIV